MTELGTRLKEAREAKGYSLDDLQNMTKIQKRYLVGIEEGNYDMMPGKFYVRAFIKQYAEAVGLDPDMIFDEYSNEIPVTNTADLPELSRVQSRKPVSESTSKVVSIFPKVLVALFVIGAILVAWYLLQTRLGDGNNSGTGDNQVEEDVGFSESEEVQQPEDQEEGTGDSTEGDDEENNEASDSEQNSEDTEPAEEQTQEISVANVSGKATTYNLQNTEDFNLEISASGDTWITVYNSKDDTLFSEMMNESDNQSFDLSQDGEAFIIVGNASATTIKVNGEQLEYEVSPTDVVRQDIIITLSTQE
ncbi:helix-turn-helix domain-containing protein [Bacillus sp. AK031]